MRQETTAKTKAVKKREPLPQPLKVLFVASECTPFVKTGGLADVIGTLPNALAKIGMDVRVIIPNYRDIPEYWKEQMHELLYFHVNLGWRRQYCGIFYLLRNNVTYYFIDNEFYFGRDSVYGSGQEEGERFGFFCRAVIEALLHVGFAPDIFHCNDWQTGMIPALLKIHYADHDFYRNTKTLFTVHNLRFQGIFDWHQIADLLGIPDRYFTPDMLEYYGCASFIKGGLVFADHISTVSPTYAQEIQTSYYGERLNGLIHARSAQLSGVLNGIDPEEYNPRDDMWLSAHFDIDDLSGKAACKADLQNELGLDRRSDTPILAMITRLTDQKGLDLVECVLDDIMRNDVQLVILGKGEEHYQELFSWAAWRYQGRLATRIELNNSLSHRIYSAADMILVPSQFEPCGLSQMIAMRYGTIPIVRETGGLKDSVQSYNQYTDTGNGFSFANYNAHEMLFTIQRALDVYHNSKNAWSKLVRRAMQTDMSWAASAQHYTNLYYWLAGKPKPEPKTVGDSDEREPDQATAWVGSKREPDQAAAWVGSKREPDQATAWVGSEPEDANSEESILKKPTKTSRRLNKLEENPTNVSSAPAVYGTPASAKTNVDKAKPHKKTPIKKVPVTEGNVDAPNPSRNGEPDPVLVSNDSKGSSDKKS